MPRRHNPVPFSDAAGLLPVPHSFDSGGKQPPYHFQAVRGSDLSPDPPVRRTADAHQALSARRGHAQACDRPPTRCRGSPRNPTTTYSAAIQNRRKRVKASITLRFVASPIRFVARHVMLQRSDARCERRFQLAQERSAPRKIYFVLETQRGIIALHVGLGCTSPRV